MISDYLIACLVSRQVAEHVAASQQQQEQLREDAQQPRRIRLTSGWHDTIDVEARIVEDVSQPLKLEAP